MKGQLAMVSSCSKGTIGLNRLTGGIPGDLDVTAEQMGSKLLAENVMIYQITSAGAKAISLSQIPSARIPSSGVVYARTNWAGKVDLIVLSNVTGSDYIFGIAGYTFGEDEDMFITSYILYTHSDFGTRLEFFPDLW